MALNALLAERENLSGSREGSRWPSRLVHYESQLLEVISALAAEPGIRGAFGPAALTLEQ